MTSGKRVLQSGQEKKEKTQEYGLFLLSWERGEHV